MHKQLLNDFIKGLQYIRVFILKIVEKNTNRDQNVNQILIPKLFINIWSKKYSLFRQYQKILQTLPAFPL